MLRHLKMELKRQQQEQQQQQQQEAELQVVATAEIAEAKQPIGEQPAKQSEQKQRRVRGRRSSKPQMEKRRRARINECLDILKSYVLNDSSQLIKLGIDISASSTGSSGGDENRDEESIARQILKSSGLINRHRGRKNPNKLEKADILELTVDYVRRLHEQRDELLVGGQPKYAQLGQSGPTNFRPLDQPLRLELANGLDHSITMSRQQTMDSPPPSSSSNSPTQPLLSISSNILQENHQRPSLAPIHQQQQQQQTIGVENSMILDLTSESHRKQPHPAHQHQQVSPSASLYSPSDSSSSCSLKSSPLIYGNPTDTLLVEGPDGCWRPWHAMASRGFTYY